MQILEATPEDVAELSTMIKQEFAYTNANPENIAWRMEKPEILLCTAAEGGNTVGFFELEALDGKRGVWRLNGMAVKEGHRGKGFGGKILEGGIAAARDGGAKKIVLLVSPENTVAKKMYEKQGFKDKGFWEKLVDGKKVLQMELGL